MSEMGLEVDEYSILLSEGFERECVIGMELSRIETRYG